MIGALFAERYSQTDHNICWEIRFNKDLQHIETSQLICIANQLTGFFMTQVSTERHFRTYNTVSSQVHFSKKCTIEKPANLSLMVITWLVFIWYGSPWKVFSNRHLPWGYLRLEIQQKKHKKKVLFNCRWHDCSAFAGTIVQQSPARFSNSHWHD